MAKIRQILHPKHILFWGIAVAALTYGQFVSFGVTQTQQSPGTFAGQCCRYSSDCSGDLVCLTPAGMAPCSSGDYSGYCGNQP